MHVYFASLNSGSNGNCYYIGNDDEAVLVDVGISCREVERRMSRIGLSMQKVKAIFISHEHSDHIRGVPVLARKYKLPVYITHDTLYGARFDSGVIHTIPFYANQPVAIGSLNIYPFLKRHDARDPHSFVVSYNHINIGVFTDIGEPCMNLVKQFSRCHAAFLEANYDEDLLDRGRYPYHLKKRIKGGLGHLSNRQALSVFTAFKPTFMSHLLLSHLSKDNNCPKLARALFSAQADNTKVIVASRYEETGVFKIALDDFSEFSEVVAEVDFNRYLEIYDTNSPSISPNIGTQLPLFG